MLHTTWSGKDRFKNNGNIINENLNCNSKISKILVQRSINPGTVLLQLAKTNVFVWI